MSTLTAFLVGLGIGMMLMDLILYFRKKDGILEIDRSDPNRYVYRFNVGDLDKLEKKKHISLEVNPNADLSQN